MEVIVIETEAFYRLVAEVYHRMKESEKNATLSTKTITDDSWITLTDAQKLLPYRSKAKWQELRDKGEVVFSQFGRKILYSEASIQKYIRKNEVTG